MPQIYHKTALGPKTSTFWVAKAVPKLKKGLFMVPNALLEDLKALDTCTERLLFFVLAGAAKGCAQVPPGLVTNHGLVPTSLEILRGFTVGGKRFFDNISWSYGKQLRWKFTTAAQEILDQRRCYTIVHWDEYMSIRRKRARMLYLFLSQFSSTGRVETTLARWQVRLHAQAETYEKRPSQFMRCVLGPALASVKINTRFKSIRWKKEGGMLTIKFTKILHIPAALPQARKYLCNHKEGCICAKRKKVQAMLLRLGVTKDMAYLMAYDRSPQELINVQKLVYLVANDEVLRGKREPIRNKAAYLIRAGQNILLGALRAKK